MCLNPAEANINNKHQHTHAFIYIYISLCLYIYIYICISIYIYIYTHISCFSFFSILVVLKLKRIRPRRPPPSLGWPDRCLYNHFAILSIYCLFNYSVYFFQDFHAHFKVTLKSWKLTLNSWKYSRAKGWWNDYTSYGSPSQVPQNQQNTYK